jgi:hypothetical protein
MPSTPKSKVTCIRYNDVRKSLLAASFADGSVRVYDTISLTEEGFELIVMNVCYYYYYYYYCSFFIAQGMHLPKKVQVLR